jgi:hypothetical protein
VDGLAVQRLRVTLAVASNKAIVPKEPSSSEKAARYVKAVG